MDCCHDTAKRRILDKFSSWNGIETAFSKILGLKVCLTQHFKQFLDNILWKNVF